MVEKRIRRDPAATKARKSRVRKDETRLDAIVLSAMDAIITIDAEGRIVLFNAAAEKLFRCKADEAIGAPLDRFIPERFRASHRAHIEQFIRTGETSRRMGLQRALAGLRTDGEEFPIEASISQATVGGRLLLTVILRDITQRVKAEQDLLRAHEALREGEARLEAIVRSAMDAIIAIDEDQRIVLFNAAAETMFGCTAAQAMGGGLQRFIPARFRDAHHAHVDRFRRTGDTARRMGMQMALAGLRSDGTEFPIEASISQATVGGRTLMTVILRDITERVNAERQIHDAHEELRQLSVAMQEVREKERTRIARELHDELGQALTALKMDVDLLGTMLPAGRTDLRESIAAMRGLLDFTVATTRRISADLRPLVLDDLGLAAAAEWLMQSVVQRAGLQGNLSFDPACDGLGEPYASALFRVMQESLTNVVRHAQAQHVDVRVERTGDAAVLTVRDDGVGMDRGAPPKPRSFGLRGISERVLMLGGEVNLASKPGRGVTLVARVPIGTPAATAAVGAGG
ncbi:MAG: PAS domain S-box protein [Gemmatimonadota bacterium]